MTTGINTDTSYNQPITENYNFESNYLYEKIGYAPYTTFEERMESKIVNSNQLDILKMETSPIQNNFPPDEILNKTFGSGMSYTTFQKLAQKEDEMDLLRQEIEKYKIELEKTRHDLALYKHLYFELLQSVK